MVSRTFKITVADPLPTSYGQDIYYRIGGWLGEQETVSNLRLADSLGGEGGQP